MLKRRAVYLMSASFLAALLLAAVTARADSVMYNPSHGDLLVNGNIGITVDENCHGTLNGFLGPQSMPCGFQNDPGPGGLTHVMTYDMANPPGLVAGDVLLVDPDLRIRLDVIRFNPGQVGVGGGHGTLVFYSDNVDGFDSQADTFGPPLALYANVVSIPEVGTEANNGAIYIPKPGQPGFVAGASAPVEYTFISDGSGPPTPVPEPASLSLLGIGALALVRKLRKKLP